MIASAFPRFIAIASLFFWTAGFVNAPAAPAGPTAFAGRAAEGKVLSAIETFDQQTGKRMRAQGKGSADERERNGYSYGYGDYGNSPTPSPTATAQTPAPSATAAPSPAAVVHMKDFAYAPGTLKAHVGDIVQFVNDDQVQHSVTAADHSFDSGELQGGGQWSHAFTKAGTYAYICNDHPFMKGTITVAP